MSGYTYKIIRTYLGDSISRIEDGAAIPKNTTNCDYMAYLAWIADGNIAAIVDMDGNVIAT